jgi:predicted transglutaminase-like cysteine proteinase
MATRLHRKALSLIAAAAAIGLLPASAHAQSHINGATLSWSKTDAILGGAPSALEAILQQQRALAPASRQPVLPASFKAPLRTLVFPTARAEARVLDTGVKSGRPDVFGTVALPLARTPLDARWQHVEYERVRGTAALFAGSLADRTPLERLEAVNWYVNKRVRFVDDQVQFGQADVWSPANDTLRRGRGDCEDFAIAKLQMLRRAGIADRDLYLVIVKDLVRRADHALLVVRAAGHMYVLDNGTDEVLDSNSISDYRPVVTLAASGAWTHGYRRDTPQVEIAAADGNAIAPLVPAADNHRSWSASLLAFNAGLSK